jgi:dTDP-4-dehydrorhamnose 3,5-epimerase
VKVQPTSLPEVLSITPIVRADDRGAFHESWQLERYTDAGLPTVWVQDNVSVSRRGVLRGLHFQHPFSQGKLVSALHGEILDVAVDIRVGSPTFGKSVAERLTASSGRQLWVPEGFAHGFLVLSEEAVVHYKCTEYYRPDAEHTLAWNDPTFGIAWPAVTPILSAKDAAGRRLDSFPLHELPLYGVVA